MSRERKKPSVAEETERLARALEARERDLDEIEKALDEAEGSPPAAARPDLPALHPPPSSPEPVLVRDPAVRSLLEQSAALTRRVDHLRTHVENVDAKLEALAQETLAWMRREDERRTREPRNLRDPLRLAIVAAIIALILLLWFLTV